MTRVPVRSLAGRAGRALHVGGPALRAGALLALGCAGVVDAQVPTAPSRWPSPQAQQPTTPQAPALLPNPLEALLRGNTIHPRTQDSLVDPNTFRGFPALTPPAFGAYPGGQLPVPFVNEGVASPGRPLVKRSDNVWPTWIGAPDAAGGFTSDVAILAQTTDFVWIRESGERVYVPLAFWDRFRIVRADTDVEVRGGGQFVLVFQGGGTLRVLGRARLAVVSLDDEASSVEFRNLSRVIATAGDRPLRLRIGTAGEVEFVTGRMSFTREGGLVECDNIGPGLATLRVDDRRVEIPIGYRVVLMPDARTSDAASELRLEGDLVTAREGRVLTAEGGAGGGAASWSGARFRLPGGARLRIDPLGGTEFPSPQQRDS